MYGKGSVVNLEMVAVLKSIKKSPRNIAGIHDISKQEMEAYYYASISDTCNQHFNHTIIHFLANVKGQRGPNLTSKTESRQL